MMGHCWVHCPICRNRFDYEHGVGRACRCCSIECFREFEARYAAMICGRTRDPEEGLEGR